MQSSTPLLTLGIRIQPESSVFKETLDETLGGIFQGRSCEDAVRVFLVGDAAYADDPAVAEVISASKNRGLSLCTEDELPDIAKASEYLMVVYQGDCLEEDGLEQLLGALSSREHGVVRVRTQKKARSMRETFSSAYMRPYRAVLNLNGTVVKSALVRTPEQLQAGTPETVSMLVRAVMDSGGSYRCPQVFLCPGPHHEKADYDLTPEFVEDMLDYCEREFGETTEYVQHCLVSIMHAMVARQAGREQVEKCLAHIDDEIILQHGSCNLNERLYLLGLKHKMRILDAVTVEDDGGVYFGEEYLFKVDGSSRLKIHVTNIQDGRLVFEGVTDLEMLGDEYELFVSDENDKHYPLEMADFHVRDEFGLDGELIRAGRRFKVSLPFKAGKSYEFVLRDGRMRDFRIAPQLLRHSRLDPDNPYRYFVSDGHIVTLRGPVFSIEEHTGSERAKLEAKGLAYLLRKKKPAVAAYRLMHFAHKRFQKKPIWIVADRPHAAKDNGEHMYRYLLTQDAAKENDIYFLLSKDSPDYERVKEYGRVLRHDSLEHKLKFLESSVIISAAANNLATNAFGKTEAKYRDLYDFDFVYLRHGVSHNDQSRWLNKLNKNMRILVSTSTPEYKGILEGDYGYTEREVKLTGLPRYDNLYSDRQKMISILPTWRKNLEGKLLPRSSKRAYIVDFKDSDYFKFYNALIHDERLLAAMKEHGYRGCFYLHPVFEAQYVDFTSSELIEVGNGVADYQTVFRESDVMVTDFSSVAFDFAYLKKPVIYSQFDEDTFYANHSWGKGYFSYRENGFGPITTTLEETVDALIECIENDCQMKQEYVDKVDAFFAYTDRNNCKRVYEAIQEIERD